MRLYCKPFLILIAKSDIMTIGLQLDEGLELENFIECMLANYVSPITCFIDYSVCY